MSSPPDPLTPEERFAQALHTTSRLWRVAIDARLKGLGVSMAGWTAIALVAKAQTPPSQSELAKALCIEGATLVTLIDRLVKAGLVRREVSETDRRIKFIHLTDEGAALYEQVRQKAKVFRQELLAGLDRDEIARAALLLERLQGLIESGS